MSSSKTWCLSLLIFLLFSPHLQPAMADEDDKPVQKLEQITVKEDKAPGYEISVVPQQELDRPTLGGSVVDSLRNQAGVQLLQASPFTPENNMLRLRGFDETRLRIERDGIPIQRDGSYGGAGSVHWRTLSVEQIESIEIMRGAVSAKYGNTLGGVIDMITKKPGEQPKTAVSTAYGSFDTWDTQLSHAAKAGPFWWSLSGSHFQTDGYLRNNDNDRNNVAVQLGMDLPGAFEIGGGLEYSEMETGMPVYNRPDSTYYDSGKPEAEADALGGPGTRMINGNLTWGDGSKADDRNVAVNAFVAKKFETGAARISYRLWDQERTEFYYDAANPGKKIYERTTEIEDNNWLLKADADFKLGSNTVAFGGELKQYGWGDQSVPYIDTEYFHHPSIVYFYYVTDGFTGQPDNKQYAAAYAMDTWRFHPDWDLELGLRQEWFTADAIAPEAFGFDWAAEEAGMDESNLDPRAAITWRPWRGGSATARFGIAHRYPTSPEHFWWYLNKGSGFFNTTLSPDKALQYELGFEQKIGTMADVIVRGYYYDIDDYISSTFIAGTGQVVYNIESVQIKGMEAELSADVWKDLRLWANVTLQDGDKSGDPWDTENRLGNEIPDFPETMMNLGADYRFNRFQANVSLNHVASRAHFNGNVVETMGCYTLLNLYASYEIWQGAAGRWELMLSAYNLLDEDYEQSEGYPMPGATVMGGLRAMF